MRLALAALLALVPQAVIAPSGAADPRLSGELTPIGAIRAASADGRIPAWDGGIKTPPAGFRQGQHHPDPFASDRPLVEITAANAAQFANQLPAGLQAMLRTYPQSYKLVVYPTRRSAAFPEHVYQATIANAGRARLTPDGNGVDGAAIGVPFPIPENGLQAIWNHLLRYRGETLRRVNGQAAVTRGGDWTMVRLEETALFPYSLRSATPATINNQLAMFLQAVTAPARLAGEILLVHDPVNQVVEQRSAWTYNPGQRRVRRAPNVAYDNPGTASDGLRTTDQFDMFTGAPDRYEWTLVGRREMIVPYNAYGLHKAGLAPEQMLRPGHINQELARYELRRVWVVEAKLKPDQRHIYSRRTFYIDEDSWQILVADQYDSRGELWRVSEAHPVVYYDVPLLWTTLETFYDLQSGRYLALGIDNTDPAWDFRIELTPADFTPDALRRLGTR
ncbi:MAG: DUF1329 domain-containing protein [Alphaproteobacteria bacterium]|nr:MAG: DUF1329 domain-containing protein [Alphaproteobacteria bacterium]